MYRILAINPGSTSTKLAVFEDDRAVNSWTVDHPTAEIKAFAQVQDQLDYRKAAVDAALAGAGVDPHGIDIFVGRGGGLVPVRGGVFKVSPRLLQDARIGVPGQHPAQLASQICDLYVQQYGGVAYIVNAPDTDEYDEIARVTGLTDIPRQSHIHALNQKEIALRHCAAQGLDYHGVNLVVVHIGGGISVAAHRRGAMVDANDIIKGEGPMTPNRAGQLPSLDLAKLCYSGKYTEKEMKDRLSRTGGLMDHLGTDDAREIERRIAAGDRYARLVYEAMLYQTAKCVGAAAAVLKGDVQGIVLTGGMANSDYVTGFISGYVSWIAPVTVLAGEFEMEALAAGALRVARGQEVALDYDGIPVWTGFDQQ